MSRITIVAVCTLLPLVACTGTGQPVDPVSARQGLIDADLALAEAVADCDHERFRSLIAEHAAFYGATGITNGADAVVAAWSGLLDPQRSTTLTWQPRSAEVAASGEIGYTRGTYLLTTPGENGQPAVATGWYVTIWRRSAAGQWQAELDIGTPPQPQPQPQLEPQSQLEPQPQPERPSPP